MAKEIGSCALCGAIVYSDDRYVKIGDTIFCTVSCAEEVLTVEELEDSTVMN